MQDTPYGYCRCGCGEKTRLAPQTMTTRGWVRGEPVPYIHNHHGRKHERWVEEDRGYETPCFIWQMNKAKGYGHMKVGGRNGKTVKAHRHYWEQENGALPEGLELDHLCETPACVRPDHLEPVTREENLRRRFAR